jgi:protein TonB
MNVRATLSALVLGLGLAASASQAADMAAVIDTKSPCSKPEYPRSSLVNEETGTVVLAFVIAENGSVVDAKVVKSSGFKNLDRAAESAFTKCKFKPLVKNGNPSQGTAQLEFNWTLG